MAKDLRNQELHEGDEVSFTLQGLCVGKVIGIDTSLRFGMGKPQPGVMRQSGVIVIAIQLPVFEPHDSPQGVLKLAPQQEVQVGHA